MKTETFKQKVLKKKYNFYGDETLILPYKKSKEKVELFKVGKYISDDDLEKEYEARGMIPAHPLDVLDLWDGEKYVATHWKDTNGKWCFAAFYRWGGVVRHVNVRCSDSGWVDGWWFAGVRKSSLLEPKTSSENLSLELRVEKLEQTLAKIKELL